MNSEGGVNEANSVVHLPRSAFPIGSNPKLLNLSLSLPNETYEMCISKRDWAWGAEFGTNEFGLSIALGKNESSSFGQEIPLLNGTEILRIGLERSKSAESAVLWISRLIEESFSQTNQYPVPKLSFLIIDRKDAFLLESFGPHWATKKIEESLTISHEYTIEDDFDFASITVKEIQAKTPSFSFRNHFNSVSKKWSKKTSYVNPFKTEITSILKSGQGFSLEQTISLLQLHGEKDHDFEPRSTKKRYICTHASGFLQSQQTNASFIVEWDTSTLQLDPLRIFYTGTASPCLSVFKPFFLGTQGLRDMRLLQSEKKYSESLWWMLEGIKRTHLLDYQMLRALVLPKSKGLQTSILKKTKENMDLKKKEILQWTSIKDHVNLLKGFQEEIHSLAKYSKRWNHPLYSMFWKRKNREVQLKPDPYLP